MKNFYIVVLLLNFFPFHLNSQTKISLSDAINIALKKNANLLQADNNLKIQESSLKSAYGNLLPSLSAQSSWGWERNQQAGSTRFFSGIPFFIPPLTTESRSYFTGLNSDVVLFDGLANIENIYLNKNNLISAKLLFQYLKQQIVINTILRYYSLMTQKSLLKVREENLKKQQLNYQLIEQRNRLGAATLADLYHQQVEVGNAELQIINQSLEVEKAYNDLVIYLGLDITDKYEFLEIEDIKFSNQDLDFIENEFDDLQSKISDAYNNRLDFKSKVYELKSLTNSKKIALAGYFPTLIGSLGFSTFSNDLNDLFDSKSYSIGLRLNIPIFSNFNTSHRIQLAEIQYLNKQIEINEMERKIKQEINQTFSALKASRKALAVSQRNIIAAEERLKIEQERYNLGSGKLLDLQIANTAFVAAQSDFVNAQYNFFITKEQLKFYLGLLDSSKFDTEGE